MLNVKSNIHISKFTSLFYIDEENSVLTFFWNSLYIAFFLMPLGINLPTPFFSIAMVLGVWNSIRSRKHFRIENKEILLVPLYFIVTTISLLYTQNMSDGLSLIQRSISLLVFPILFLFVKEDAASVKRLFYFLLLGILVSFSINMSIAVYHIILQVKEGNEVSFYTDVHSFVNLISRNRQYFRGASFSRLINTNYISLYVLLVLSYYLKQRINSRLRFGVAIVLFVYLFLLASKAAYLTLLIIAIVLITTIADREKKYMMTLICILGGFIFLNNIKELKYTEDATIEYVESTTVALRMLTWDASIELIKEAPLFGYGVGDANAMLLQKYQELGYTNNYKHQYNAHNQFFQTLLQTGVVGFSVLVSVFIVLAIRMRKSRNEFAVFLILLISLIFESMLVRFNGIVFFSIIIPLLLKKRSILSSKIIRNKSIIKE